MIPESQAFWLKKIIYIKFSFKNLSVHEVIDFKKYILHEHIF